MCHIAYFWFVVCWKLQSKHSLSSQQIQHTAYKYTCPVHASLQSTTLCESLVCMYAQHIVERRSISGHWNRLLYHRSRRRDRAHNHTHTHTHERACRRSSREERYETTTTRTTTATLVTAAAGFKVILASGIG